MSATTSLYMRLKRLCRRGDRSTISPVFTDYCLTGIDWYFKRYLHSSHCKSLGTGRFEYVCNLERYERCVLLLYTGFSCLHGGEAV